MRLFGTTLIYILVTLFLFNAIISCRKTENINSAIKPDNIYSVDKFFKLRPGTDLKVIKVIEKLRTANYNNPSFPNFIKTQGIAVWDKALIQEMPLQGLSNTSSLVSNASNTEYQILIPLVPINDEKVHGAIAVRLTGDSISFKLLDGSNYMAYNTDSIHLGMNGRQLSVLLMNLHKHVFGQSRFKITDSAAFGGMGRRVGHVIINSASAISSIYVTHQTTVCLSFTTEEPREQGNLFGCPPVGDCPQTVTVWHPGCEQIFVWEDDGTGYGEFENDGTYNGPPPSDGGSYYYNPETGWEAEPEACDPFILTLQNDVTFSNKFKTLNDLSVVTGNIEKNIIVNDRVNNSYSESQGAPNSSDNTITLTGMIDGRLHDHYAGLNSIFSPQDVIAMCEVYLQGFARDSANLFSG